jgi:hypothetical protein
MSGPCGPRQGHLLQVEPDEDHDLPSGTSSNVTTRGRIKTGAVAATVAGLWLLALVKPSRGGWDAEALRNESTLDFLTVNSKEGEHWSRVWLVVIDDEVYIRLGSRAAERMEANSGAPFVKVRVAGRQYDRVRAVATPEQAAIVAKAMADKYRSDLIIRFFPHPLTMRLRPEAAELESETP